MCPSKFRNVSGILIQTKNYYQGNYLFDCGEGSYNQLLEKYGSVGVKKILLNLKAIVISHSHSDHHLGSLYLLE